MRALSTFTRGPSETPGAFAARAEALGAEAVVLDRGTPAAFRAELPERVRVLALEPAAPTSRRAPRLATDDKEERRAALTSLDEALAHADHRHAGLLIVRLGAFEPGTAFRAHVERTLRRERRPRLEDLARDRLRATERALDLARWGLEPLLERAAARDVTVCVPNVARWFELPTVVELGVLLVELAGAPLATWLDPAAAHARAFLGFEDDGWLEALAPRAAGAWLADAAGLRGGLPWGTGEVDRATLEAALPKDALAVVHADPGASDDELRVALGTRTRED